MNESKKITWIKNNLSRKIVKDSVWLLFSQAVLALCGILLNIIITKNYGITIFGSFSLSLKIYLVASIFSTFGVGVPALKYSAQYTDNRSVLNKSMSSAIILVLISAALTCILLFFALSLFSTFFSRDSLKEIFLILLLSLPIYSINKVLLLILNGQRDIKAVAIIQILRWVFIICIISFCSYFKFDITFVTLSFPITELILLIGTWIYKNRFFSFNFSIDKTWLKEYFSFGGKSMISYAITDIYSYLDVFLLGFFADGRVVGMYSFASDITKNLLVVADIFFTNFNPIFTSLFYQNKLTELNFQIKKIRNLTYLIYLPLITFAIIVYYILIKWMNTNLEESFLPFVIISIGIFLFSGFKPFMAMLEFAGLPGEKLKLSIIILAINLILIILFNYLWNVNGVALATALTYVFSVLILDKFSRKNLKISLIN